MKSFDFVTSTSVISFRRVNNSDFFLQCFFLQFCCLAMLSLLLPLFKFVSDKTVYKSRFRATSSLQNSFYMRVLLRVYLILMCSSFVRFQFMLQLVACLVVLLFVAAFLRFALTRYYADVLLVDFLYYWLVVRFI